jgi:hypothetical protein
MAVQRGGFEADDLPKFGARAGVVAGDQPCPNDWISVCRQFADRQQRLFLPAATAVIVGRPGNYCAPHLVSHELSNKKKRFSPRQTPLTKIELLLLLLLPFRIFLRNPLGQKDGAGEGRF